MDLVERLDTDGRFGLFAEESSQRATIGSVLMVEFVTSRTQPRLQVFAGVLVKVFIDIMFFFVY